MPGKPARLRRQRGAALMMAIIVTSVCMVIVVGLSQYIVMEYRSAHLDWKRVQTLYCAEAGIEHAVDLLGSNPGLTAIADTPLSTLIAGAEGSFEVAIAPVTSGGNNDPTGAKKVTATGYFPDKANAEVSRTVVATYAAKEWDFGSDAVRARQGVEYASNEDMTVVVNSSYSAGTDLTVDASIRVTGTGATIGAVDSIAANKARVAGTVHAPGWVDVRPDNAREISENDPENYIPTAFPDPSELGTWDEFGNLIFPPEPGTWADAYYQQALAGGTETMPSGTIVGSRFINLYGSGTLSNVTLRGPGIVFVHGNLGGNVTNGAPPVTLVVSGNFHTDGGDFYRFNAGTDPEPPPSLILFGPEAEVAGNSHWYLDGPLFAFNPNGEVMLNDSAIGCVGAIVSNGMVNFKSSKAKLGFPQRLSNRRFVARGMPMVTAYAAR